MKFGWINLFGAVIVLLIMIPNIVYAAGKSEAAEPNAGIPRRLEVCEQIGRYGCILLMWLPLFVWKFGFVGAAGLIGYLLINGMLLIAYYVLWAAYFKKKTLKNGMALSVIPAVIFLVSGLLLRHWSLVVAAVLFGFAHGRITFLTHKMDG